VRRTFAEFRSPSRAPRGAGRRLTVRRALALVVLVAAVWLVASVRSGPGLAAAPTPTPTTAPCRGVTCSSSTLEPTQSATPVATPVPTATPTPALPTVAPTPYSEAIVNAPPTGTLPTIAGNTAIVPRPNGAGSPLPTIGLLAIVFFGLMAGTCFFLFFRIR